ncbi:MAG: hypothetical protein LBI53_02065 [Candidatus Peribacteria bacterium]|nr:hypothetical protein [Candidatus Peribacteria bacterium]
MRNTILLTIAFQGIILGRPLTLIMVVVIVVVLIVNKMEEKEKSQTLNHYRNNC